MPHSCGAINLRVNDMELKTSAANVFVMNLKKLYESKGWSRTQASREWKIPYRTFESIIKLERCPSLDTAESIAKSSGYELWQMLAPNFNPMNPPLVRDMSNDEIAFYARLADLVKQELPK